MVLTGIASADEIVEKDAPFEGSRRAVDLTGLDTFAGRPLFLGNDSSFSNGYLGKRSDRAN